MYLFQEAGRRDLTPDEEGVYESLRRYYTELVRQGRMKPCERPSDPEILANVRASIDPDRDRSLGFD